jgi:methionyl-tRNA synthetase
MRLATEVNRYLDTTAPWFSIKTDRVAASRSVYTALRCIDSLKILFAPVLPHTSAKLHIFLGYTEPLFGKAYIQEVSDGLGNHRVLRYEPEGSFGKWQPSQLTPGQRLNLPAPLFKKLDESIAAEERARLGK